MATDPRNSDAATGTNADVRMSTIWKALEQVFDPEIPVLSIVDMGMIAGVRATDQKVSVDLTPTFVGCPAVDVIRANVFQALSEAGERNVEVNLVYDPPWTSDRISESGRARLQEFGLAPPVRGLVQLEINPPPVACPYCGSAKTEMESMFGPTLCRAIYYCHNCLQPFEHFKNV